MSVHDWQSSGPSLLLFLPVGDSVGSLVGSAVGFEVANNISVHKDFAPQVTGHVFLIDLKVECKQSSAAVFLK